MNTTSRHGSAVVTTPNDTQILITRRFDAPPALVYRAWTTPELVRRWWGSDEDPLVVCDIDLRVGGTWRYVARHHSLGELGWHGTYRAITPETSLVSTEVFEGFPDAEALNTLTLSASGGVTTLTVLVEHSSVETETATSTREWRRVCSARWTASTTSSPKPIERCHPPCVHRPLTLTRPRIQP